MPEHVRGTRLQWANGGVSPARPGRPGARARLRERGYKGEGQALQAAPGNWAFTLQEVEGDSGHICHLSLPVAVGLMRKGGEASENLVMVPPCESPPRLGLRVCLCCHMGLMKQFLKNGSLL